MGAAAVLDALLTLVEHTAALSALYQQAAADGGRDLTPAEIAQVQSLAQASISKLAAATA